jgi:hypothetical protein
MIVPFAKLCDRCRKRSEEFSCWPTCRECGDDICPACAVPGSITDPDLDTPSCCLCFACREEERAA